jgi:hypothetical protein
VSDPSRFLLRARLIACGAFTDDMPKGHQAEVWDITTGTRLHLDVEVVDR